MDIISTLLVVGVSQSFPHEGRLKSRHGSLNVGSLSHRLWEKPYFIAIVNCFSCNIGVHISLGEHFIGEDI